MAGMDYAGPVGNVGFDKDGGCLAIEHTRTLVVGRGRSKKPMVFDELPSAIAQGHRKRGPCAFDRIG